jgi:hypothetical protein
MNLKIKIQDQIRIINSSKDFLLFDLNKDKNKITCYKLTDDLQRYKKNFEHFRVLSCIKNELSNKTINI